MKRLETPKSSPVTSDALIVPTARQHAPADVIQFRPGGPMALAASYPSGRTSTMLPAPGRRGAGAPGRFGEAARRGSDRWRGLLGGTVGGVLDARLELLLRRWALALVLAVLAGIGTVLARRHGSGFQLPDASGIDRGAGSVQSPS